MFALEDLFWHLANGTIFTAEGVEDPFILTEVRARPSRYDLNPADGREAVGWVTMWFPDAGVVHSGRVCADDVFVDHGRIEDVA